LIAEKALLGTILKENHLVNDTMIKPIHLAAGRHRVLLELIKKLVSKGQYADSITLSMAANPDAFGGISYVNELLSYADPVKMDEYEQLVLAGWKEREKRNILALSLKEDWEIGKVIHSLDNIYEIRAKDHKSINDEITDLYESPWRQEDKQKGVYSGINKLDILTNGWQDGEVTIIAARPSMGKTDLMLHLAKQAGWQGYVPIIFSLEMPAKSLTQRLIASTGGYHRSKMRDPYKLFSEEQKERWPAVLGRLNQTNLQIFDEAGQTIPVMRTKIRKIVHQYPNKKPIVFIDYMGLIKSNESYGGNMNLQITEISKNLKGMAKDFHCPVVCLSQLNRSVEQRQNKRPMMSDIRDSGSVEQDADVILFLYREKYYDKSVKDYSLEMIIAKNRNGAVSTVKAMYNEHTGEIKNDHNDQRII
jgi:replicative DNA helicase